MAKKKKRRGLGGLGEVALRATPATVPVRLNPDDSNDSHGGDGKHAISEAGVVRIPVAHITANRYQPRTHFSEGALASLAASIRADGLIQPVIVRATDQPDRYELIAGERRLRAAKLIPLDVIPAIVRRASEREAMLLALVENLQREDLSVLEEAAAVEQLIIKFDLTQGQAAEAIGRSRPAVANLLRLLKLGAEARLALQNGQIEMGHARALLNLPADKQADAARLIVAGEYTVRATEQLVAQWQKALDNGGNDDANSAKGDSGKGGDNSGSAPEIAVLERELSEKLGAPVQIKHGKRGGKLLIRYSNLDVFDHILNHIK